MKYSDKIIECLETHDVEGIKECFENGVDPNSLFKGEPLVYELTSEYLRSPRFKQCVKTFVDYGVKFEDKALLAVLLDDVEQLDKQLQDDHSLVQKQYNLRAAFTPLFEVGLLHICAEFNHFNCAKLLIEQGADIDFIAGIDQFGFGGQSPVFHTVNQIQHQSNDMMNLLIELDADLKLTVPGLIWGKGYEWETLIPAVNPISYAMMGLLPQMNRSEETISIIVSRLLKAAYNIDYSLGNVPNKYLKR